MLSSIYVALAVLAISFTSAAPHGQPISVDVAMENVFRRANPAPVSCGRELLLPQTGTII
jgi:hypothetical protein